MFWVIFHLIKFEGQIRYSDLRGAGIASAQCGRRTEARVMNKTTDFLLAFPNLKNSIASATVSILIKGNWFLVRIYFKSVEKEYKLWFRLFYEFCKNALTEIKYSNNKNNLSKFANKYINNVGKFTRFVTWIIYFYCTTNVVVLSTETFVMKQHCQLQPHLLHLRFLCFHNRRSTYLPFTVKSRK